MKITLAVLFLAGLTIYCKCTAVLSLPPSLIARAASLERTQTPKSSFPTDNGLVKAGEDSTATVVVADDANEGEGVYGDGDVDGGDGGGIHGGVDSTVSYKNFKNLWQKNFGVQKRERNAFEDDIAAVVAAASTPQMMLQPQQHQSNAAIKNNKNALKVVAIPRQQQQHFLQPQQQQTADIGNNNFLNIKSSATIKPLEHQLPLVLADDAEEYASNKWQSTASGPQIMDDIIVSPPYGGSVIEDNREDDGSDGEDTKQQTTHDFIPETGEGNDYDTAAQKDDSPDPVVWSKFLRPLNHWPIECQGENENNCPQAYYSALIADRRNALSQYLQHGRGMKHPYIQNRSPLSRTTTNMPPFQDSNEMSLPSPSTSSYPETIHNVNNDDIVLLLTAEQKLIQFLTWALAELYPLGKFSNVSENSAEYYHPGMYLWKKFNLSGRLEPPLLVEEPHYVIVRREYDQEDDYKRGSLHRDDPFIPPRGRKHNLPDLDALLQRYETFVPNRGRRDKIKDIFKYDDLFYPNRGKRQMTLATTDKSYNDFADADDDGDTDADDNINIEAIQQLQQPQLFKGENVAASLAQMQLQQHPLTKTLQQINNVMAKMKRKLHQILLKREQQEKNLPNTFDEMMSNKMPATRMSTTYQPPQQHLQQLNKRFKSMANILQQQRRQHTANNKNLNFRRQWWKRYSTMDDNDRPAAATSTRSRTMATNRLHALRSMSPQQQQLLAATSAMPHHRQQQSPQHTEHTSEYLSSPHLYQANKFMWQPAQQFQLRQPTLATTVTQQFDPLSWHKLQMLQHQYHLPLLTMRHPRLTAQQHMPAAMQQHVGGNDDDDDEQLATPQETQLPLLYPSNDQISSSVDNTVANDLKNLYNLYSD